MEQILPYFGPEFVISLNMNSMQQGVKIPISLNTTTLTQEYEGDFSTRRFIVSSYQFIAKSYVYGEIKSNIPVIDNVDYQALNLNLAGITYDTINIS